MTNKKRNFLKIRWYCFRFAFLLVIFVFVRLFFSLLYRYTPVFDLCGSIFSIRFTLLHAVFNLYQTIFQSDLCRCAPVFNLCGYIPFGLNCTRVRPFYAFSVYSLLLYIITCGGGGLTARQGKIFNLGTKIVFCRR